MLPSECVADILGHGVIDFAYDESAISQITPIQTLGQSTIAQSLHQANQSEKFESLFLSLWSDDFEPNYSKTNRGSVWIMTLTIHPPTNQFPNKKMVYPIAVGPKGKSHHKVIEKIMDDIRQMNREHYRENPLCLYNHSTKSIVKLSVHLICVTQDQPERRGFCSLLTGGKTHGRWGYSVDLQNIYEKLIPCNVCIHSLA